MPVPSASRTPAITATVATRSVSRVVVLSRSAAARTAVPTRGAERVTRTTVNPCRTVSSWLDRAVSAEKRFRVATRAANPMSTMNIGINGRVTIRTSAEVRSTVTT